MMKEAKREMEKTCIDCAAYLVASSEEFTEYGICLNDEAFEPFIDDLIEMRFASCRELVEQKKFVGDDRPACPDFEEAESIEIDDESPLGQEVRRLAERGDLTPETLEAAILEERLSQIDFKREAQPQGQT